MKTRTSWAVGVAGALVAGGFNAQDQVFHGGGEVGGVQADFDELRPRLVLLAATAGTFVLAVAVQGAWGDDGPFFGAGYFA